MLAPKKARSTTKSGVTTSAVRRSDQCHRVIAIEAMRIVVIAIVIVTATP